MYSAVSGIRKLAEETTPTKISCVKEDYYYYYCNANHTAVPYGYKRKPDMIWLLLPWAPSPATVTLMRARAQRRYGTRKKGMYVASRRVFFRTKPKMGLIRCDDGCIQKKCSHFQHHHQHHQTPAAAGAPLLIATSNTSSATGTNTSGRKPQ